MKDPRLDYMPMAAREYSAQRQMTVGDLLLDGVTWKPEPTSLPADRHGIGYESSTESIRVADGVLTGEIGRAHV